MKLWCTNIDCMRQNNYEEYEFDAPEKCPIDNVLWENCEHAPWDEEVKLKCPKCGSSEHIAPAWVKSYRFSGEVTALSKLKALDAELQATKSRNSSKGEKQ